MSTASVSHTTPATCWCGAPTDADEFCTAYPDKHTQRRGPSGEAVYTLAEARTLIRRQECDTHGHHINETLIRNHSGTTVIHRILCDHCGAAFQEVPTP